MRIPDVIIEGSEYDRLNNMRPHATKIDGVNAAFCEVLPDAVDPIVIDSEPEDLLVTVAGLLLADDRSKAIHIRNNQLQTVFESPEYQLFAGNFESLEALQELFLSFTGAELIAPNLTEGKALARATIEDYFGE